MDKFKKMEKALIEQVECQMERLEEVDAKELGEVIDMIKDLEETMYYHSVVKAMEESDKRYAKKEAHCSSPKNMYMEHKGMHADNSLKMKDLEAYAIELTKDIMEMIEGATVEEKQMLQQQIAVLSQKIV